MKWRKLLGRGSTPAARPATAREAAPTEIVLRGDERVAAVGESHYQPALLRASGTSPGEAIQFACRASLVPEPNNPYDPNAIAVHIDEDIVGYLARADAISWQPVVHALSGLGQIAVCDAMIAGRGIGADTTNLGVFLHLPSPADALAGPTTG